MPETIFCIAFHFKKQCKESKLIRTPHCLKMPKPNPNPSVTSADQTGSSWAASVEALPFIVLTSLKARTLLIGTVLSTNHGNLTNILLLLGASCCIALLPWRSRRIAFLTVVIAISILLFTDKVHYRAFHEFATARELGHAGQLADVFTGIFPYVRKFDLVWMADWPLWIFLAARRPCRTADSHRRRFIRACAAGAALSIGGYGLAVSGYLMGQSDKALAARRDFAIRETGVLNFHLFDVIDLATIPTKCETASAQGIAQVQQWFRAREISGKELTPFGVARGRNLIFLQVESLEAFVIGLRADGQEVTPILNRLTTNSFYFNRFFSQASLGGTSDAEFCALNSLLPARNGVVVRQNAYNTFRALPAILREHHYETIAMSVCLPNLWNMGQMHRAYGFQNRYYNEHFAIGPESPLTIPDDRFLSKARETLRKYRQPFFAHLMTISSHTPFTRFPKEQRTLQLGAWEGSVLGDYLQAVHFVDRAVGQFLEGLQADGLATNSVIIIYGDHQAVPDEEWARAKPYAHDAVGLRLDDTLHRRVPAFIIIPGASSGGIVERPCGQIDLAPSVLHLLGVPAANEFFLGENLFRDAPPLVYFRTGAFADATQFYTGKPDSAEDAVCSALRPSDSVDPEVCRRTRESVRQRIQISDRILEQNLVPTLLKRLHTGSRGFQPTVRGPAEYP